MQRYYKRWNKIGLWKIFLKKTHKKTNNLAQHSAIHFFYTTFTARFVPKPLIQGYRMKRESGESPEQSRCCELI